MHSTSSPLPEPPALVAQLRAAWNAHDLDALVRCFDADYESVQPLHPERSFRGTAELRRSWAAVFDAIPDFQAELLDFAERGQSVWTEWRWSGCHVGGGPFNARGIMILGLGNDCIAWARLYTETTQTAGPDWEAVLDEILRGGPASPDTPGSKDC